MIRAAIVVLATGLAGTACGGDSRPGTEEDNFVELQFIFARSCATSSCHGDATTPTGNLLLSYDGAYCNLTGVTAGLTFRTEARADFSRRVVAGNRQQSFLYKKLTLSDAEMGATQPLGERMPRGGALDAAEVEKFGSWIDKGARDAQGTTGSCQ